MVFSLFVLAACEESQAVCLAYRSFGHFAFSCDLLPCSGGHPEWHIQADVLSLLPGYASSVDFVTSDGSFHRVPRWDLVLAFPPCTDLCASGARWFKQKRESGQQQKSIDFFMNFVYLDYPHICIENPIGIMSSYYRKPDQIVQPWQFGHGEVKATCFWLKGLPPLIPTCIVPGRVPRVWRMSPGSDRSLLRSKTYPGIAYAMANQWGCLYE